MKSLFSENDIVLPEWLGILLEKVLLNRYPVIETLLEDSGGEYIRAGTSCSIGVFSSQR